MADTLRLGRSAERCRGSSPPLGHQQRNEATKWVGIRKRRGCKVLGTLGVWLHSSFGLSQTLTE